MGATLTCDVVAGRRGPQVSRIHAVDAPGASPDRPPGNLPRRRDEPAGPAEEVVGSVKFFNAGKGYGFVMPDGGRQDVSIQVGTLARADLDDLAPLQRVRVRIGQGRRGLQAIHILIIRDGAASR